MWAESFAPSLRVPSADLSDTPTEPNLTEFEENFPFSVLQKNEWLCLNCQTQRLLEGSLGDPAPMPLPAPKQPPPGSPRHQPPAASQHQRAPAPAEPAAPPERQPSPARSLRAAEPSRAPSPAPPEKKPPAPSEEKPLPKAAPKPSRAPESTATPKGKSETPKAEGESKESRAPPEAPRAKEQEVSSGGACPRVPTRAALGLRVPGAGAVLSPVCASSDAQMGGCSKSEQKLCPGGSLPQERVSCKLLSQQFHTARELLQQHAGVCLLFIRIRSIWA